MEIVSKFYLVKYGNDDNKYVFNASGFHIAVDGYTAIILISMIYGLIFAESAVERKERALPHDANTGKICYQEVVKVDSSITKEALYSAARSWFAITFKSAIDVLQMEDKDSGKLIGKGNTTIYVAMNNHRIHFTVTIQVKPARYKYSITDFTQTVGLNDWGPLEDAKARMMAQSTYAKTDKIIKEIISSLKKAMLIQIEDDNW